MNLSFTAPGVMLLLLVAAMAAAEPADEPAPAQLLRVDHDTTWTSDVEAPAGAVLAAGSHVRLEGATLRLGGLLEIEPGATLELRPSGGRPARILGDAQGWIAVNGTLLSAGAPRAEIAGLWGESSMSFINGTGGIQVHGQATLDSIHIHDGNGPVSVQPGGRLDLSNSTVERLGEVAIATYGTVNVRDSEILESTWFAISGREGCSMTVRDSRIGAIMHGILANECDATLSRLDLQGAGIFGSNGARFDVEDVMISDYVREALTFQGGSGADGIFKPVHVTLRNIDLDGGQIAAEGLHAEAANVTFDGLHIRGHLASGVFARDSIVRALSGTIGGNGRHGIEAIGGKMSLGDVDFTQPQPNGAAPVSHTMLVTGAVEKGGQPLLGPKLTVWDNSTGQVVASWHDASLPLGQVNWEAYRVDADGKPVRGGPYRYQIEHAEANGPTEGVMAADEGQKRLVAHVQTEQSTDVDVDAGAGWNWAMVLVAAGALLLVLAFVARPARNAWRRRRQG